MLIQSEHFSEPYFVWTDLLEARNGLGKFLKGTKEMQNWIWSRMEPTPALWLKPFKSYSQKTEERLLILIIFGPFHVEINLAET